MINKQQFNKCVNILNAGGALITHRGYYAVQDNTHDTLINISEELFSAVIEYCGGRENFTVTDTATQFGTESTWELIIPIYNNTLPTFARTDINSKLTKTPEFKQKVDSVKQAVKNTFGCAPYERKNNAKYTLLKFWAKSIVPIGELEKIEKMFSDVSTERITSFEFNVIVYPDSNMVVEDTSDLMEALNRAHKLDESIKRRPRTLKESSVAHTKDSISAAFKSLLSDLEQLNNKFTELEFYPSMDQDDTIEEYEGSSDIINVQISCPQLGDYPPNYTEVFDVTVLEPGESYFDFDVDAALETVQEIVGDDEDGLEAEIKQAIQDWAQDDEAAEIIYSWYQNEDAFEDFDDVDDFIDYAKSDIHDMLDAASVEERQIVAKALGIDTYDDEDEYDDDFEEGLNGAHQPDEEAASSVVVRRNEAYDVDDQRKDGTPDDLADKLADFADEFKYEGEEVFDWEYTRARFVVSGDVSLQLKMGSTFLGDFSDEQKSRMDKELEAFTAALKTEGYVIKGSPKVSDRFFLISNGWGRTGRYVTLRIQNPAVNKVKTDKPLDVQ